MPGVYIFPSDSERNLRLGIDSGSWSIRKLQKKESMIGKARSMSIGDYVLLYLNGEKTLHGLFQVTQLPDFARVVTLWDGEYELPFKFTLCQDQELVATMPVQRLMSVLPSLRNKTGAWTKYITKYNGMTVFQKQTLTDDDMVALSTEFVTLSRRAAVLAGLTSPADSAESNLSNATVQPLPEAVDLGAPPAARINITVSRIVRDTELSNWVKKQHSYRCQICGESIKLADESSYAEGHHLQPLGNPHNGPDVAENIVCLCPNHHAICDFGAMRLEIDMLRQSGNHKVSDRFISYHNRTVFRG